MVTYYITGHTFYLKEEIKAIKPTRKDFKNWWKYNYDFKCWELEVPNSSDSKRFRNKLQSYCDKNNLKLEVYELTKPLTKSMNDFETIEAFFDYMHKINQRPKL
ncbi:hypothetical protein [Malaciobacter mytili]|uniref:hypothetical protein n=1 Tax=Malaciobacter mytili TaxID=603050 RepID=UPI003A8C7B24